MPSPCTRARATTPITRPACLMILPELISLFHANTRPLFIIVAERKNYVTTFARFNTVFRFRFVLLSRRAERLHLRQPFSQPVCRRREQPHASLLARACRISAHYFSHQTFHDFFCLPVLRMPARRQAEAQGISSSRQGISRHSAIHESNSRDATFTYVSSSV